MGSTTLVELLVGISVGALPAYVALRILEYRLTERPARARATFRHRHDHGPTPITTAYARGMARAGEPFPLASIEREWRWQDDRRRAQYERDLRRTIARLYDQEHPDA